MNQITAIKADPNYVIVVGEDMDGQVVCTATLLVERKFIHGCGSVGHVEDVVVDERLRGQRVGQRLVKVLSEAARLRGCYKVILDCEEHNVPFYEGSGFKRNSQHMALYFQ
jgi:glucosamine-phosphate N-acetyltransferase